MVNWKRNRESKIKKEWRKFNLSISEQSLNIEVMCQLPLIGDDKFPLKRI